MTGALVTDSENDIDPMMIVLSHPRYVLRNEQCCGDDKYNCVQSHHGIGRLAQWQGA